MLPNGDIVLTYFVGSGHTSAVRVYRHSSDGGHTWGPEHLLTDGSAPYMTGAHDRLRQLSNGRLVQVLHSRQNGTHQLGTLAFTSDDAGHTWTARGSGNGSTLSVPLSASRLPHSMGIKCNEFGFWEAAVAEVTSSPDDGRLLMVGRTCTGWLYQSTSTDWGGVWSDPVPVGGVERVREGGIRHPLAPPNIVRVTDKDREVLVLVYSSHFNPHEGWELGVREVLGLQISRDGGVSWGSYRHVEGVGVADEHVSYCSLYADQVTRTLHLTYRSGSTFGISTRYLQIPFRDIL